MPPASVTTSARRVPGLDFVDRRPLDLARHRDHVADRRHEDRIAGLEPVVARTIAALQEVVEVDARDLNVAAQQAHLAERAELGRPAGAVERVRHGGERAQGVDAGLADLADDVNADGAQPPHGHAGLEAAKEPGELVPDQTIGLGEREPPDPEVTNFRKHDPPVAIDRADQGAVDRSPDVDREVVAGTEHVVGSDGNVVDGREGRYVRGEHRVAVLPERRAERPEVGLRRLILIARALRRRELLQERGLLRLLRRLGLLHRELRLGLLEAPDLLDACRIQIEAGSILENSSTSAVAGVTPTFDVRGSVNCWGCCCC
jgi:hypothetical protein